MHGTVRFRMGRNVWELGQAEWNALYESVLVFARKATRSPVQASEVTQEAFARLLSTRPWNEEGGLSLFRHMTGIVRSLLSNERTSKRGGVEHSAAAEWELASGSAAPSAEEAHLARSSTVEREQGAASLLGELSKRVSGSPLELAILSAMIEGVTTPAELAIHTGRPVSEVYVALRRIRRHAQSLCGGMPARKELS